MLPTLTVFLMGFWPAKTLAQNLTRVSNMTMMIKTTGLHCPEEYNAISSCSEDNHFVYYTCCGEMNMFCCQYYQVWVITSLSCLTVLLTIFLLVCLVRCCCSYKRKTQQSYHFDKS